MAHTTENEVEDIPLFSELIKEKNLSLRRNKTTTLQINMGLLCNQSCKHCHLEAGPNRSELMTRDTIDEILLFQERCGFDTVDITGGAPELNQDLPYLIQRISSIVKNLMLRSNLTALYDMVEQGTSLVDDLVRHHVSIVSSLPSLNQLQTDSQRGDGIFLKSMKALNMLNEKGYGKKETGLVLNLVSNPAGAFMPSPQKSTQERYREILQKKWGIEFNEFYSFANMPLGRFGKWLRKSNNYQTYIKKLFASFNACTVDGLMCKNLISVSWDGYLYDCDFNQAAGLDKGYKRQHISQIENCIPENDEIAVDQHCYACTAGSGFT